MEHSFKYWHGSLGELSAADRELIAAAREAASAAYAPITHFGVGAAVRLRSGTIRAAHNIESPIGVQSICAERNVLLGFDSADPIEAMAVASASASGECYPCGVCRQAMTEVQARQGAPFRVLMTGAATATMVDDASLLLPFVYKY